jgi:hypothetical protein
MSDAHDLPRGPGTLYAVRIRAERFRRIDYGDAYTRWKAGTVIYTKDGNGTRAERDARPWEPVDPPS